jgi:hypothetical protein
MKGFGLVNFKGRIYTQNLHLMNVDGLKIKCQGLTSALIVSKIIAISSFADKPNF